MFRSYLLNYILLILWLALIFLLSSEPSTVSSGRSGAIVDTIKYINPSIADAENITFLVRKAAHITAYFILGVLMFRVIRMFKLPARKAVILSAALVALYAITDELHQLLVNGRSGEVRDVLIDTSAGALGVLVTFLIIRKYTLRKWSSPSQIFKNKV
jgi:VanZ family protein